MRDDTATNLTTGDLMHDQPRRSGVLSRRRLTGGFAAMVGAASVSTLLAACGGDDDDDAPAATAVPDAPADPTATEAADDAPEPTATEADTAPEPTAADDDDDDSETPEPVDEPTPTAASGTDAPQQGGTAVIITANDPATLNMALTTAIVDAQAATKVQEALVRMTVDGDFEPHLAESWEITDDGLTYTFQLRQGVTWNDGEPFTSADVEFTVLEVASLYHPITSGVFENVTSIETPDDHTVIIHLENPFGPFLIAFMSSRCPMTPKHIFEGEDVLNHPASLTDPVGTGPFMLTEWNRGESLTLDRNPNYWQEGRPYLDRIVLRIVPQSESRTAALLSGEADYMFYSFFDTADFEQVRDNPDLQYRTQGGFASVDQMFLNVRNEILDNRTVRQALYTALDREFILDTVKFGIGEVSRSHINQLLVWPYNPAVDLTQMYPYDPDLASDMLDEAGYPMNGGTRFSLRLPFNVAAGDRLSQVLREMWRAVGIDVELEPLELQAYNQRVFVDWDFDVAHVFYTSSGDPELGIKRAYVSSSIVQAPNTNAGGWSDPEVDDLFDQGAAQPTNDLRAPYYYQIQEILAEEMPVLPLFDSQGIDIAAANLDVSTLWRDPLYDGWETVSLKE